MSQRAARVAAMQILFASVSQGDGGAGEHLRRLRAMEVSRDAGVYEHDLVVAIVGCYDARRGEIERLMADVSGYELADMTLLERSLIACAVAEMLARRDVAAAVVIDEAVEIAKGFGADKGYALVNGILSAIARQLRKA